MISVHHVSNYSFQSPYAYATNNPVLFRDILGMGKGSYEIWEKAGKVVTIPNHGSKSIPKGTLNSIRKAVEKILDAE